MPSEGAPVLNREQAQICKSLNQDRVLELAKRQLEKRMSQGSSNLSAKSVHDYSPSSEPVTVAKRRPGNERGAAGAPPLKQQAMSTAIGHHHHSQYHVPTQEVIEEEEGADATDKEDSCTPRKKDGSGHRRDLSDQSGGGRVPNNPGLVPISEEASGLETGGSPLLYEHVSGGGSIAGHRRPQYMAEQGRIGQPVSGG